MLFIDFISNICMRYINLSWNSTPFLYFLVYIVHKTVAMQCFAAYIRFGFIYRYHFENGNNFIWHLYAFKSTGNQQSTLCSFHSYSLLLDVNSVGHVLCTFRLAPLYSGFGESQNTPLPLVWVANGSRHGFFSICENDVGVDVGDGDSYGKIYLPVAS